MSRPIDITLFGESVGRDLFASDSKEPTTLEKLLDSEASRQEVENAIKESVQNQFNFGHYIRRYYCDRYHTRERETVFAELSDEDLMKEIISVFKERGMFAIDHKKAKLEKCSDPEMDISKEKLLYSYDSWSDLPKAGSVMGSLDATKTTKLTPSRLAEIMALNVYNVDRETMFLFALGFGMSDIDTSYFLTHILRQPDFNPRSADEFIYYYCLKNDKDKIYNGEYKGFEGVFLAKKKLFYSETVIQETKFHETAWYQDRMENCSNDDEFMERLNSINRTDNSRTTRDEFKAMLWNINTIVQDIRNYDQYHDNAPEPNVEELLRGLQNRTATGEIPFDKDVIKEIPFPNYWNRDNISNMLTLAAPVTRKNLLTACYIPAALEKEQMLTEEVAETWDFMEIKELFELDEAQGILEKCGMEGTINASDPYEFFLLLCLVSEKPYSYFMNSWKFWHDSAI